MRRHLPPSPLVEPLESRIAPAAIVFTPTLYTDVKLNPKTGLPLLQFINTLPNPVTNPLSGANLAIAETAGENPDVYFIKLSAGEDLRIHTTTGFQDLVNVTQGTVVAFFTDVDHDNVVSSDDLTGLAIGAKTSVALGTGVSQYQLNGVGYGGNVVTNYNPLTGTLGGASEPAGTAHALLVNPVISFSAAGPIEGAFVAGGAVSKLDVTGTVNKILTGTAANGYAFSFEGVPNTLVVGGSLVPNTPGNTVLTVATPGAKIAGPSISNAVIASGNLIQLGIGGPGAAGGSLLGLTLLDDTTGITVLAGAGGSGAASGGAGGTISNVLFNGPPSTAPDISPNSLISLTAGAGGTGTTRGGAGGAVKGVFVDYDIASINAASANDLFDNVLVQGGAGGNGNTAGAGGALSNINVITSTYHLIGSTTPEFQLLGGAGGISFAGGRGGAGGSITNAQLINEALPQIDLGTNFPNDFNVPNQDVPPNFPTGFPAALTTTPTATIDLIQGGAGGAVALKGAGGAGGAISGLTVKGFNFDIFGGGGGNGFSAGGAGGAVSTVDVLGSPGSLAGDDFHAESLVLATGAGGNGATGKGGAGGALTSLIVDNADFALTHPDLVTGLADTNGLQITTGAGGIAGKGAGGAGGAISTVKITDIDFVTDSHPLGNSGLAVIAAGNGGAAPVAGGKGGAGGAMTGVNIIATRINFSEIASGTGGAGGAGALAGRGGAGGTMTNVAIRSAEGLYSSTASETTGLLVDNLANFTALGEDIQIGDIVENSLTFATTTVTNVSPTELALASNIIAAGDPYEVTDPITGFFVGIAMDDVSQNFLLDNSPTTNFTTEGLQLGDVVVDVTSTVANNNVPVTATITGITPNELTLNTDIFHAGDQYEFPALAAVHFAAGAGGAGVLTGAGGAGGGIINSSGVSEGSVTFAGGAGGIGGATAKVGAGGTLNNDGAFSSFGSGSQIAGNAGATGAKAAAGGSVIGADVQALLNVTLIGGTGTAGGAGGNITSSGFSGVLAGGGRLQSAFRERHHPRGRWRHLAHRQWRRGRHDQRRYRVRLLGRWRRSLRHPVRWRRGRQRRRKGRRGRLGR